MTARAYLRKSRGEEADPELLAAHRSILVRLAEQDGMALPPSAIVEEIGSADNLADRPAFLSLLDGLSLLPGPVVLYCMDIDRLTKGPLPDRAAIYVALVGAGVRIRTPSRWYDLTNADDELIFELKAMFGRQENAAHHRRVKAKWDEMTRKGMVLTGMPSCGYRWDKNIRNFIVVPEEAALVQSLFADAVDESTYRLGRKYGIRPSQVLRILTNPTYTGWPARHCEKRRFAGRKKSTGTVYLHRDEWTWPEQPGTYPALVSREQFEQVQQALRARHRVGEKTGTAEAWCRDVVQFEALPGRIVLGSHKWAQGRYLSYEVRGQKRLYADRTIVHDAANEAILRVLTAPGLAIAAAEAQRQIKEARATARRAAADVDAMRAELDAIRSQLDQLLTREIAATDSEEVASIARVRDNLRAKAAMLSRDLQGLNLNPERQAALSRILRDFPDLLENGERAWRAASQTMKRTAAQAFLSRVIVRITPQPHPQPFIREVAIIEYQAWVKKVLG